MHDEFQTRFSWITGLLARPVSAVFEAGTCEHAVLTRLKLGWGKGDTAELLRELTQDYGEDAGRAVEEFLAVHVRRDWAEIGRAHARPGHEIDDFIRLLWDPLKDQGFEFGLARENGTVSFQVTRCPQLELADKTGLRAWLYHLACSTDPYSAQGFSPRIVFARTKTLMQGDDCCDHCYRYAGASTPTA